MMRLVVLILASLVTIPSPDPGAAGVDRPVERLGQQVTASVGAPGPGALRLGQHPASDMWSDPVCRIDPTWGADLPDRTGDEDSWRVNTNRAIGPAWYAIIPCFKDPGDRSRVPVSPARWLHLRSAP